MSENKCICFWHQQLAHVSNVQIISAFKLVKSIDLGPIKKYNPIKVFVDLENLDNSEDNFQVGPTFTQQSTLVEVTDPGFIH